MRPFRAFRRQRLHAARRSRAGGGPRDRVQAAKRRDLARGSRRPAWSHDDRDALIDPIDKELWAGTEIVLLSVETTAYRFGTSGNRPSTVEENGAIALPCAQVLAELPCELAQLE